jgi:hypothetical protein
MTDDQKARITELASKAYDARLRFEALAASNTTGLTQEQRRQQFIDYELAKAEMFEANATLSSAMDYSAGTKEALPT